MHSDHPLVKIGNETYEPEGNYASKKDAEKNAALHIYKTLEKAPTLIQKQATESSANAVPEVDVKIPEEDSEMINWKNKLQVVNVTVCFKKIKELCVKNSIALPAYKTSQFGASHEPNFEVVGS